MTSSYDRNISRLKASARQNFQNQIRRDEMAAKQEGDRAVSDARALTKSLEPFSKHLKDWAERENKAAELRGMEKFRQDQKVNNQKLAELQAQMNDSAIKEEKFQELKAEYLRLSGPESYAQADRIAKLSPWEQVGYGKLSLKRITDTLGDRLDYEMQNNEQPFNIHGVTFSAKEIRENNIQGLPFKELLVNQLGEQILHNSGYYEFTPEFRELAGANTAIDKVKSSRLSKIRTRYNIDASQRTRAKSELDWRSSPKTGSDLYRMLLTHANTVDGKNNILGNTGSWDAVMKIIASEANGRLEYADTIGSLEIPPSLAKQLGVKQGTTFAEHWPNRFKQLRKNIKTTFTQSVKDEKNFLDAKVDHVGNLFTEEAQAGKIDGERLQYWEEVSWQLGGALDTRIKNYKTLSDRDIDRDITNIDELIDSNNGSITHAELNQFNPSAASKYRDQADKHEKAFKKKHNVDGKIKAVLNQSWTDAGITQKEKPVVWEYALARATQDYERKLNLLVSMGFDADSASKLALDAPAGGVKHPETGDPILDFEGVVSEIQRNGANSKYTVDSQRDKDSLSDAMIRVHQIDVAKKEMLADRYALKNKIVGGAYGEKRLNEIIENQKIWGTWEGITRSEEALKYYQGLALGKRGMNAHGIIDAQLKAAGLPGLFPTLVEPDQVEEENEQLNEEANNAIEQSKQGGSIPAYNSIINSNREIQNLQSGGSSVYNENENVAEYLQ